MKNETSNASVRLKPSTRKKLKVFAAQKLTNFDGAVQILLKQGNY